MDLSRILGYYDARPPKDQITHRVPHMPVMINGEEQDPEIVLEYENEPLHTVYDQEAAEGALLRIYTTEKGAKERVRELYGNPDSLWPEPQGYNNELSTDGGYVRPNGRLDMYEDIDIGGCEWSLGGTPLPASEAQKGRDFTKLMSCGFLFWGWKSANDRISSMDWKFTNSGGLQFYEHINISGSSFRVPGVSAQGYGHRINNLHQYGWGDRISSVTFYAGVR